ncbi:Oidioi.mRNA.OKI2018_I69.PAR.g10697.t1.cds [Oikopleura dioica]|uniref:Oidioi.mRNA.OKI2018_I69.PAR.g10697.t1.cds n=1 Tax=Oikopleura dioica TaxID=34765 RepID=A0ABN7RW99_OIKDI|nr:Oidioi.mRNA.OKI2018_I69.PAR.g10697.t1.cds [Oikopleura dioica]
MGFKSKLSAKDLEKAQRELNEDPKTRDQAIKSLRTKCKTSRKIPSVCWPRLDDGFLLRFLRVSKFDLDKAVDRLEKYFELQKEWPELYGESVQVHGVRVVGDQGSLSFAHIRATPMRVNKMWSRAVDGCYPFRSKGAVMIKFPGWFMSIFNLFQTFMSQKMKDRIVLIGRNEPDEKLFQHVPAKYLPEDMGGEVSNKNQAEWTCKLKKLAPKIEADFAYLKSHCSTTGTYRKIEDDDTDMLAAMEIAKLKIENAEVEEGTEL